MSIGEATKIEEYVPMEIPTIKAKTKLEILRPPKIYMVTNTISVVREVLIERVNVWLMLLSKVSSKSLL